MITFKITKEALQEALKEVGKAIPSRSTLPILQSVLCETRNGTLILSATNPDFSLEVSRKIQSNGTWKPQRFCIPYKPLNKIVDAIYKGEMIQVEPLDGGVQLKAGTGTFRLPSTSPEDFPVFQEISSESVSQEFPIESFREAYDRVAFCAADPEAPREYLKGIYWHTQDGSVRFVASDSHRLAYLAIKSPSELPALQAILPIGVLKALKDSTAETVKVILAEREAVFSFGESVLRTRLIEGPYAPYEQILPEKEGMGFKVNTQALLKAVKRLLLFASPPLHLIVFDLSLPKGVHLIAQTPYTGEAEETLDVPYTGESLKIGFNGQYLAEILQHVSAETVKFDFYAPLSATRITPLETDLETDAAMFYLFMPVKLD